MSAIKRFTLLVFVSVTNCDGLVARDTSEGNVARFDERVAAG